MKAKHKRGRPILKYALTTSNMVIDLSMFPRRKRRRLTLTPRCYSTTRRTSMTRSSNGFPTSSRTKTAKSWWCSNASKRAGTNKISSTRSRDSSKKQKGFLNKIKRKDGHFPTIPNRRWISRKMHLHNLWNIILWRLMVRIRFREILALKLKILPKTAAISLSVNKVTIVIMRRLGLQQNHRSPEKINK